MNDIDHQRAQRLMLEAQVDPAAVSPTDRHWLQAHLEGCPACRDDYASLRAYVATGRSPAQPPP